MTTTPTTSTQLDRVLYGPSCSAVVPIRLLSPAQQGQVLDRLFGVIQVVEGICWRRGEMIGEFTSFPGAPVVKVFASVNWWRVRTEVTSGVGFMFAASGNHAILEYLVEWLFRTMAGRVEASLAGSLTAADQQHAEEAGLIIEELARRLCIPVGLTWPEGQFTDRVKAQMTATAFGSAWRASATS